METTDKSNTYTRRYVHNDSALISTRKDRLTKRDELLLTRYYYWTEIKRRRFDDVTSILADQEFFLDPRYISDKLLEHDDLYKEMCIRKPSARSLSQDHPSWNWSLS